MQKANAPVSGRGVCAFEQPRPLQSPGDPCEIFRLLEGHRSDAVFKGIARIDRAELVPDFARLTRHLRREAEGDGRIRALPPNASRLHKRKQVLVDDVGISRGHAVREARIDLQRPLLQELNADLS